MSPFPVVSLQPKLTQAAAPRWFVPEISDRVEASQPEMIALAITKAQAG